MWSIGNEIHEREDATRIRISRQLAEHVRNLDNTRAVTQAVTGVFYPDGWESTAPVFEEMDVCGYKIPKGMNIFDMQATYDERNHYSVNTTYIITVNDKYLPEILNSTLVNYYFSKISSSIRGG